MRLSTNRSVLRTDAFTMAEAWQKYDLFLTDPNIHFADEPPGVEAAYRNFTQAQRSSPNVWNDAYIAAFGIVGGFRVVTFDVGSQHYSGLTATIL